MMTIFWIFVVLLCVLNAADIITIHLIFKKGPNPRKLNPLLAGIVKKGSPFVGKLALLKVTVVGVLVVSLWGGMHTLAGGEVLAPALLGFVSGWYAAIVARNIEELLRLR